MNDSDNVVIGPMMSIDALMQAVRQVATAINKRRSILELTKEEAVLLHGLVNTHDTLVMRIFDKPDDDPELIRITKEALAVAQRLEDAELIIEVTGGKEFEKIEKMIKEEKFRVFKPTIYARKLFDEKEPRGYA